MAKERDYKHELELAKARGDKRMSVAVTQQMLDDFTQKCVENNTTKNAVLKQFILEYTYGEKAAEMAKPARQRKSPDRDLER